jgi:predicted ribosomally synthesized peptide with SipW-like signal peptide
MNRKILLSLGMIVFVAALSWGATGAFFSDSESSTGNTFTAGDIDLQIDNESYVTNNEGTLVASPENSWSISNLTNQLFFSFSDVKPGDIGEDTISVHVGSNDAWACMAADITATPENSLVDPETDAGDVGPASGDNGELQGYINFAFWKDDGDNVYEVGEQQITQLVGSAEAVFSGNWVTLADSSTGVPLDGGSTSYVAKAWCFGGLTGTPIAQDGLGKTGSNGPLARGTGFTCNGSGANNVAQTDGVVIDVSFQAVQARNNGQFLCSGLPPFTGKTPVIVNSQDLALSIQDVVNDSSKWLFYNDTNDTVMTINQFSGSGGVNDIVTGPAGVGSAQMTLHDATGRYNIATYKYKDVKLSDIGSLRYRIYDDSASSETPFLHFNVDFANNDTWQKRLVMVPVGVAVDTWTTVDAINGGNAVWTYSGATWPAGVGEPGTTPGTTGKTWSQILTTYPNAETRSTDSFLGVRVGHPGPAGENSYVDWVEFDGELTNFEN